jgi:hypothetical protein
LTEGIKNVVPGSKSGFEALTVVTTKSMAFLVTQEKKLMLWQETSPPSSRLKSIPHNKPTRSRRQAQLASCLASSLTLKMELHGITAQTTILIQVSSI